MTLEPPVGIVSGSGLDLLPLLDTIEEQHPFQHFRDLPGASVSGHEGDVTLGHCGDVPIVLQRGRVHFYEGHDDATVTRTVDVLAELGVRTLLLTSAAGGLRPDMREGELMAVARIRMWPCKAWPDHPGEVLPDIVLPGVDRTGTYVCIHGPSYETRAEIRAMQQLGGDAVGMSTAAEVAYAQAIGLRAGAVSCIVNNCCVPQILTHDHVVRTAQAASARFCDVLRNALNPRSTT